MTTCRGPECDRPAFVTQIGLCQAHNRQRYRGAELTPLRPRATPHEVVACPIPGCAKFVASRGLCSSHATRAWKMGVAPERLVGLLAGECAICGAGGSEVGLVLDHDHGCCPGRRSCGRCLRGMLCQGCNTGLGAMRDDPERLRRAAEYVANPPGLVHMPGSA